MTTVLVLVVGAPLLLVIAWWRTRPEDDVSARRALRSDVVGCYALFGEEGRRVDTTYYNASPFVELDSMPCVGWPRVSGGCGAASSRSTHSERRAARREG